MAAAMAGAVDLAAVKARPMPPRARRRPRRRAPPSPPAPWLGRRRRHRGHVPGRGARPLLPGAGRARPLGRVVRPVKQLSPVLERLAAEGGGSWVLAKVDVDANPALAQGLRVQGIPAVKAVWQGQLVAEFNGAIPEEQARQFVNELVKATTGGAVPVEDGEAPAEAEDPRLDAAEAALERGDLAAAEAAYRAILDAEPDHPEASLALKQVQLFRRADEAGPDALAAAEAAPDDVTAQARAADFLLGTGNVEEAFDDLLGVVRRTAGEERDQARTHLVELFAIVGRRRPAGGRGPPAVHSRPVLMSAAEVAGAAALQEARAERPDSSKPDADVFGKTSGRRRTRAGT